jgi:hypothetical protein
MKEQEIITYRANDGQSVDVFLDIENDTVWLTQAQMVLLFGRDQSVVSKHIKKIFIDGELDEKSNMHFLHIANSDKPVTYYNLDVILAVGYRVKSPQGIEFRRWASRILKEYLLQGYVIHRPVSKQELEDVRKELEQQIENLDIITNVQFQEIYDALINLLSKGKENSIHRPIGFKTKNK